MTYFREAHARNYAVLIYKRVHFRQTFDIIISVIYERNFRQIIENISNWVKKLQMLFHNTSNPITIFISIMWYIWTNVLKLSIRVYIFVYIYILNIFMSSFWVKLYFSVTLHYTNKSWMISKRKTNTNKLNTASDYN